MSPITSHVHDIISSTQSQYHAYLQGRRHFTSYTRGHYPTSSIFVPSIASHHDIIHPSSQKQQQPVGHHFITNISSIPPSSPNRRKIVYPPSTSSARSLSCDTVVEENLESITSDELIVQFDCTPITNTKTLENTYYNTRINSYSLGKDDDNDEDSLKQDDIPFNMTTKVHWRPRLTSHHTISNSSSFHDGYSITSDCTSSNLPKLHTVFDDIDKSDDSIIKVIDEDNDIITETDNNIITTLPAVSPLSTTSSPSLYKINEEKLINKDTDNLSHDFNTKTTITITTTTTLDTCPNQETIIINPLPSLSSSSSPVRSTGLLTWISTNIIKKKTEMTNQRRDSVFSRSVSSSGEKTWSLSRSMVRIVNGSKSPPRSLSISKTIDRDHHNNIIFDDNTRSHISMISPTMNDDNMNGIVSTSILPLSSSTPLLITPTLSESSSPTTNGTLKKTIPLPFSSFKKISWRKRKNERMMNAQV